MRRMSDTIARLAALGAQRSLNVADHRATDRLMDLAAFGPNPGGLRCRFYLPDNLPEGAPLVVVLHGCTQNAAGYDHGSGWSRLADEAGFALIYPEQQRSNNPNLCFNWFLPEDTRRDFGEALSIRQMIETMVVAHGLDRQRIFVTGLSAGGAMASAMLATYPEVFAGGAIIAGLPHGSATTVPEAFDRMRGHGSPTEQQLQQLLRSASQHKGPWPTISIWQGSADHTVASSNAEAIAGQWRGVHKLAKAPTHSEVEDGHTRRVWSGASGRALIELYTIAGMGHGTPLMTKGDDGLGVPGPFMLDVGISSTRRIAQFWGIAESSKGASAQQQKPRGTRSSSRSHASVPAITGTTGKPRENATPPSQASDSNGVRKIIETALRNAGLMR